MADMTSAQGLCAIKRPGYHFSRDPLTTWTKFEGLSVAHNFAGGQNDNNK